MGGQKAKKKVLILGIAIGLLAWAIILLSKRPTHAAGAILFVCQFPFAFAVLVEFLAGKATHGLLVFLILDLALAGIAWVLLLVKRKNQG